MNKITSVQAISELNQIGSINELFALVKKVSGNVFNIDGKESQQIRLLYSGDISGDVHTGELVYDLVRTQPEKYTEIGKSEVAKFLGKQEFIDKLVSLPMVIRL